MRSGAANINVFAQPVFWIGLVVLGGWFTKPLHGIDETLVALMSALVATAPGIGPLKFKDALREVEWGLLVFLAATIFLAKALVSTKVASQLIDAPLEGFLQVPGPMVALVVAIVGVLLHLVVHSRTARVAVLVPPILVLAPRAGIDPLAITLVAVAATGYCQKLMVSAKPVILFGKIKRSAMRRN